MQKLLRQVMTGVVVLSVSMCHVLECAHEATPNAGARRPGVAACMNAMAQAKSGMTKAAPKTNSIAEQLDIAIEFADVQRVQEIVLMNPELVHMNVKDDMPLLVRAAFLGRTNVVKVLLELAKLLELGAIIDIPREKDGITPLHAACARGYISTMQLLLEERASVDVRDVQGHGSLYLLYKGNRNPESWRMLLDAGANVNFASHDGETVLIEACDKGDLPAAQMFIEAGAAVNAQMTTGLTPLKAAIAANNVPLVSYLLDQKAHPDGKLQGTYTPLARAVIGHNVEIVRRLLEAKADPTKLSVGETRTLSSFEASEEMSQLIKRALQEKPADEEKKE